MKSKIAITCIAIVLSGCATYMPVPEGFTGPTAQIRDSFNVISSSNVEFFYVAAIDGHYIENSRFKSLSFNRGRGLKMTPVPVARLVPAKPQSFVIVGRTEYAAPILAIANDVFQVKGTLQLTPEAGKKYVVKGDLSENDAEVWLEDESTKQIVGSKIKVVGSAKLGFFEK